MSIATWEPSAPKNIDNQIVTKFIKLSEDDLLSDLSNQLGSEAIQQQAYLMKALPELWQSACESLDNAQIQHLIRFFTLAEMQLSGWEAGDKSPVIVLIKILKGRNAFPEKDFIRWIKQNTDNRFLPYGPVF